MNYFNEVIAAVSTPPGKGGVAVIRMSGDGAFEIAERVFIAQSGRALAEYPARVAIYGYIVDEGERIDDVLLTKFTSPASYTGEDTVEISCHGGVLVTRTVLETLLRAGAVPASAGEFTRRAFVRGRLTLTEAEAISELLEAKSREQIRLSSGTARTRFKERIASIRESLVSLMSSIYARIDYPDEDLGDFSDDEVGERLSWVRDEISTLLSTYRTGRAVSEGVRAVICGKPNVGKSSFYNLILGEDSAIVTDIAGTTRDVLEREIPLGRVMLRLADTAGIRHSENADTVERIGIEKSRQMIEKSELLFAIFDNSREFDDEDAIIINQIKGSSSPKIAIINKCDKQSLFNLGDAEDAFDKVFSVSIERDGESMLGEITRYVESLFIDGRIVVGEDAVISSARQNASLLRAFDFINAAYESLALGFSQDAVSSDVERAVGAIAELDGRAVSEEIVSDIFSKFCVGK